MRKLILLFSVNLFFSIFCIAQEIDKQRIECVYKLSWISDITKPDVRKQDHMILLLGDRSSDFYSYNTFRFDSLVNVDKLKNLSANEGLNKRAAYGKKGANYHIYKNYPSGKNTIVERIVSDYYKYEELTNQNWKIYPEKATVAGYPAQKASCSFGGRQFIAWFTSEIPISSGPWKFSGLPGLIVKVSDKNNEFVFEMIGLRKVKGQKPIVIPSRKIINTTGQNFQKINARFHKDPVAYINTNTNIKITKKGNDQRVRSIPYNPIELY